MTSRRIAASWNTRNTLIWSGVLVFVAAASIYTSVHPFVGLASAGALLVASTVAVSRRGLGREFPARWIPVAWVALLFVSDHRSDPFARTPLAAAHGNLSVDNVIQLVVYAIVFAMVVHSRRLLVGEYALRISKLPILLFPIVALASALWSLIPLFTAVRAMQLLVIASLALLSVRIWRSSPELGKSIWVDTLKLFVQVVTIASIVGFLVHDWPDHRFTWPGILAVAAAIYPAVALLILIVGGRSFSPYPQWTRPLRLILLATATYLGQTRTVLGALLVAGLAALWTLGRERPLARYIGISYYVLGVLLLVFLARDQLVDYLSRGEGTQVFETLNSRIPLWELGLRDLSDAGRWVIGFGYGAPRVVLFPQVAWAGTAHSAWIEALMGVGIIGLALLCANILFLLWRLAWSSEPNNRPARLALVLLIFILVLSGASEVLVLPGVGFGLFALIHVPALGSLERSPRAYPSRTAPAAWFTRLPGRAPQTASARARRP